MKLPWLGCLSIPFAVVSSLFFSLWSLVSYYCHSLFLLIWGILGDRIDPFGVSHLSSKTQSTPQSPKSPTTLIPHTSLSGPPHRLTEYKSIFSCPWLLGMWPEASPLEKGEGIVLPPHFRLPCCRSRPFDNDNNENDNNSSYGVKGWMDKKNDDK